MSPIQDIDLYISSMSKSMTDKMFFMDMIPNIGLIVDYGCADGELIKTCNEIDSDISYVGYDIDQDMVAIANNNIGDIGFVTDKWDRCVPRSLKESNSVLVLSSVIHEVYSYGAPDDIHQFWKRVFCSGFDYIVIRDLVPDSSIDRMSHPYDYYNITKNSDRWMIKSFEKVWGSLSNNKNLIHYLMKYRYEKNWDREVCENYFPIYKNDLLNLIPDSYKVNYYDHYILPYVKDTIKNDMGVNLVDNTHVKLIIKRSTKNV